MLNKDISIEEDIISTSTNPDYNAFLGSWYQIEKLHPDIARVILEFLFGENMGSMHAQFTDLGGDVLRQKIIDFVQTYLAVNAGNSKPNANQNPKPNQNYNSNIQVEQFVIEQKNVVGATLQQIKDFMQQAVNKANSFVERINYYNNTLAASLRNQIKSLYNEYLIHVASYNPQWQYIKFIRALNALFENISAADYPKGSGILESNNFMIKKVSMKNFDHEKFKSAMEKALKLADEVINGIKVIDPKLGDEIYRQVHDLYKVVLENVLVHNSIATNAYKNFVNRVNDIFVETLGNSASSEGESGTQSVSGYSNEKLLKEIGNRIYKQVRYPKKLIAMYNELKNSTNPDRQDLLDLWNIVKSYNDRGILGRTIRMDFAEGKYIFFDDAKYDEKWNLDKMKAQLKKECLRIKISLPNLYKSLSMLFFNQSTIDSISSVGELINIRIELRKFCDDYLKFHRIDQKWYGSIQKQFGKKNHLSYSLYN